MIDKLRPLGDRILVRKLEPESKTAGGIIIPGSAQEKVQMGRVMRVGKGRIMQDGSVVSLQIGAGDLVYYGKYAGVEAGDDYVILKEEEVLGVVEEDNK
jgi:chaperonin GroES